MSLSSGSPRWAARAGARRGVDSRAHVLRAELLSLVRPPGPLTVCVHCRAADSLCALQGSSCPSSSWMAKRRRATCRPLTPLASLSPSTCPARPRCLVMPRLFRKGGVLVRGASELALRAVRQVRHPLPAAPECCIARAAGSTRPCPSLRRNKPLKVSCMLEFASWQSLQRARSSL